MQPVACIVQYCHRHRRRRWQWHWLARVGWLPQALATLATEPGRRFGRGATGRAALFQGLSTVLTKEGIILVGRLTGSTDHSPASHDVGRHPKEMGKAQQRVAISSGSSALFILSRNSAARSYVLLRLWFPQSGHETYTFSGSSPCALGNSGRVADKCTRHAVPCPL